MENKKPTVFLSSTIYDFKDLRSAIKYYLEELGFEVWLSEHNDFPKPLEQNTIDACLSTLEQAAYYILLIGARVGGYYDRSNKISITRMEYRKAYELTKVGKTRCIFFVRDELQKIKQDRKALEKFLKENYMKDKEISSEDQNKITNYQSDFANDAEVIFDFINEVSRNDEMQLATESGLPLPGANWIHSFTSFRDIVDILRTNLNISNTLSTVALNTNLKRELVENLVALTQKWKDGTRPAYVWTSLTRKYVVGGLSDVSIIPSQHLKFILAFSFKAMGSDNKLSAQFINQGLSSGQFLNYNKDNSSYEPSLISEKLFQLSEYIDTVKIMTKGFAQFFTDLHNRYIDQANSQTTVSIPNIYLLAPLSLADRQEDVVNLSVGIYKALEGDFSFLETVKLNHPSPLPLEVEKLKEEAVALEDVVSWLSKTRQPDHI